MIQYTSKEDYYHHRINQALRFLIPHNKSLLYYGQLKKNIVPHQLYTSKCVIITTQTPCESFSQNYDVIYSQKYEIASINGTFDYIVFNGSLGETSDICCLLKKIKSVCTPSTRIIVYQHNYLWQSIIQLAEFFKIKRKEKIQNWLSIRDLKSCLKGSGITSIRTFRRTIFPLKLGFIGPLLNYLSDIIPIFDALKFDQFIIARPVLKNSKDINTQKSLSIVLTVRNEKGNIQPIIEALPQICSEQEILFVEGHSTDGTVEEIQRIKNLFPDKNIQLMGQPGKGQGDAIRVGFHQAKGDIIILYEGDGTSNPNDIQYFYDMMCSGRFDFIEGSRFIYPLDRKKMPFLKQIGNLFFAKWFSWILGQYTTDVLSGIKAISKKEYKIIYENWGFLGFTDPFGDFELLYGSFRFGLNFCEIPMRYEPRPYGESKTSIFNHGFYLLGMAVNGYFVFRSTFIKGGFNQ